MSHFIVLEQVANSSSSFNFYFIIQSKSRLSNILYADKWDKVQHYIARKHDKCYGFHFSVFVNIKSVESMPFPKKHVRCHSY